MHTRPASPTHTCTLMCGRSYRHTCRRQALRDNGSSDAGGTEATLTYRINSVMRLQLQVARRLTRPSLLLQYSSDGMMSQQ